MSRRSNRRHHYEEKEKAFWKLIKEERKLWAIERAAPKHVLETPRKVGYKKSFRLRDDIARRKDAHVFQQILDEINDTVYSKDPDFKVHTKYGFTNLEGPTLRFITQHRWDKLLHFRLQHRKHFAYRSEQVPARYPFSGYRYQSGYKFLLPWMFEVETTDHYITTLPTIYPEVESRLDEIHSKIRGNGNSYYLDKILNVRQYWDDWDLSVVKKAEEERLIELERTAFQRFVSEEG